MTTLLDLLDAAVTRYGERGALALRHDDGTTAELELPRAAATDAGSRPGACARWTSSPGDRILTWSPSTPELAGRVLTARWPRASSSSRSTCGCRPQAVEGIVAASGARHLVLGTGRDAPDPREAGLEHFPTTTVEALCAEPAADDPAFPPDWEARQAAWARPPPTRSSSWSSPRARPARRRA